MDCGGRGLSVLHGTDPGEPGDPMRALDLFCGGGGAAEGMASRGHEVTGIDVGDMAKYYPGTFERHDVRDVSVHYASTFDFIWASPPCQRFTNGAKRWKTAEGHPDLIDWTRRLLMMTGRPWCIENVPAAPLRPDLMLCGQMFNLPLARHRIFELHGFEAPQPKHPAHRAPIYTVAGHAGGSSTRDGTSGFGSTARWREAMGIDWLPGRLLKEAVPPLYSRFIVSCLPNDATVERIP